METQAIIEDYIQNVANYLPRKLRDDVALELRGLLTELLESAARDAGRPADAEMTVEALRSVGQPEEVAARYASRGFDLIQPGMAPLFVKLAAVAVAIQWALTLPRVFSSAITFGEWWLRWGFSAFAWVGALVLWFGAAAWVQRRSPVAPQSPARPWTHWIFWVPFAADWRPLQRVAAERRAAASAFPLGVALTLFFIAPAWIIGLFAPAGTDTSWVMYDASFRQWLLLPILALMAARLVLFAVVAANDRLRAPTEGLRFALWIGFVAMLCWVLFSWHIFVNVITDSLFKAWLSIFLLVNTIQIIVWIYRALTRVRVPKSLRSQASGTTLPR